MTANVVTLLLNGLTLALAMGLLILILWHDANDEGNRYFALFLMMVVVWSAGSMLARSAAFVNGNRQTVQLGLQLLELGFTGSTIAVYIYSVVLTGIQGRFFRAASLVGLTMLFVYQLVLALVADVPARFTVRSDGLLEYDFGPASSLLYAFFQGATIYLVWRNRLKIRSRVLTTGILMFSVGQVLGLLSPQFRMLGVSEDVSALAALMVSYAVVNQRIMTPLLGRAKQLEAVRDVSLAVTSRLRLKDTLSAISAQAAGLLEADGAAIFLMRLKELELAAVYELPTQFVGHRLPLGQGVAGTVALERSGRRVDRYGRDWQGEADLPLARETFGAVAGVPLMFADEVVGVLLVVVGMHGRLFDRDDMHMLELLGPQAAVAITNSRLFEAERGLTDDLTQAKTQLETLLTSTENPVIAIDRAFRVIFANVAASKLLKTQIDPVGWLLTDFVPATYLPPDVRQMMRDLRAKGGHVFEVVIEQRTFLCHVAELGGPRTEGWVVVLNDVTELKELDRLKSQMIQMTSHDLKNPLQAAMWNLELLNEEGEDVFNAEMEGYTQKIWAQLERMYRIIDGILGIERVRSGSIVLESCDLNRIIERVVEDLDDQALRKGLSLHVGVLPNPLLTLGDTHQLSQALANLVDNAIKFTPEGGQIEIGGALEDGWVMIFVKDSGIGIPTEEQPRVFERFFQVGHLGDGVARGSGLGLSLVKAVVENHQGTVDLSSEPGVGTTIRLRFPRVEEVVK